MKKKGKGDFMENQFNVFCYDNRTKWSNSTIQPFTKLETI